MNDCYEREKNWLIRFAGGETGEGRFPRAEWNFIRGIDGRK